MIARILARLAVPGLTSWGVIFAFGFHATPDGHTNAPPILIVFLFVLVPGFPLGRINLAVSHALNFPPRRELAA